MMALSLWIALDLVVLGAALWGPIVSNVEKAKYSVIEVQKI